MRKGVRYAPIRDGDKFQARGIVNRRIKAGLLPDPDTLPCVDCGDTGKRHCYDHHLGYSAEHQLDVQSVCYPCSGKRSAIRGECKTEKHRANSGRKARPLCQYGHPITVFNDGKRRCRTCKLAYWKQYNDKRRKK